MKFPILKKEQLTKLKQLINEVISESSGQDISPNTAGKVIANVGGKTLVVSNFTNQQINITAKPAPGETIFIDIR